jgi:hypothetical protein
MMNIYQKLAVMALLVSGFACSDEPKKLTKEGTAFEQVASAFPDHPLSMYMVPSGYTALQDVLGVVKKDCRNAKEFYTDRCQGQVEKVLVKLESYGFKRLKKSDFMQIELYKLPNLAQQAYSARLKAFNKEIRELEPDQRKAKRKEYNAFKKDVTLLRQHLKSSRNS